MHKRTFVLQSAGKPVHDGNFDLLLPFHPIRKQFCNFNWSTPFVSVINSSFEKVQIFVALAFWQTGVRKYAGAQVEGLDFMVVPYGENRCSICNAIIMQVIPIRNGP